MNISFSIFGGVTGQDTGNRRAQTLSSPSKTGNAAEYSSQNMARCSPAICACWQYLRYQVLTVRATWNPATWNPTYSPLPSSRSGTREWLPQDPSPIRESFCDENH